MLILAFRGKAIVLNLGVAYAKVGAFGVLFFRQVDLIT
jgi:hypothetical protein